MEAPWEPREGLARPWDGEDSDEEDSAARRRRMRTCVAALALQDQLDAADVERRRRVVALAGVLASMDGGAQGPQGPKYKEESSFSWDDHVQRFTDVGFKKRYRLDWGAFNYLLELIRPDLEAGDERSKRNAKCTKHGVEILSEVKLAVALRYLAGGAPDDLRLIYHISEGYVYTCTWLVVDAVNRRLQIKFPLDDPEKLAVLESEFRAASIGGVWEGQVGCVDGVHFEMQAPSKRDVADPQKYHVMRKDCYALLAIAVCDQARRFTFYEISKSSTSHDSLAWDTSTLGARVKAGELRAPYFINGDSAFSCSDSLVTPIGGGTEQDTFDYHQSSNRMPIECAFGVLYQRWGILWRPLRMAFPRRSAVIGCLMRLHNLCIDRRIEEETKWVKGLPSGHWLGEVQPDRWAWSVKYDKEGRPVEALQTEVDNSRAARRERGAAVSVTRERLVELVKGSGIRRPPLPTRLVKKVKKKRGRRAASG